MEIPITSAPTGACSSVLSMRRSTLWWRSPYLLLFLVLLTAYAYTPPRWQDWNQNSRFDLTRAIVERRTVRIDAYAANTGDYATIDGYLYSDKAPGLSLAAVPVYAAVRAVRPLGLTQITQRLGRNSAFAATLDANGGGTTNERIDAAVALYLVTLAVVSVPAALMGVLLALLVTRLTGCRTAGILSALVMGLATPVFTYAQAFYGHVPAAVCLVGAAALLVLRPAGNLTSRRLLALGALLGYAAIIEYPAVIPGVAIAIWAVALARQRAVVFGILGAAPPLLALAVYDLIAFGTVRPIGYERSTLWQAQHQTGFMSLTYPSWDALWGLIGSPYRGLFFFAPVLFLILPGVWWGLRNARMRGATLVALSGWAGMVLFASSSVMWWGGFAVGPRYILPAVPLLALPLGATLARVNRVSAPRIRLAGLAGAGLLAGVSASVVWAASLARQNYPPDTIARPLTTYAWPAIREGDIARNLGMALKLSGVASVAPLLLVLSLGVLWIVANLLRPAETTT